MTDLTQYLTELHRATKVGFFVADHQGHLTERFKAPAMPDLPSIYLTRLIKHSLASGSTSTSPTPRNALPSLSVRPPKLP